MLLLCCGKNNIDQISKYLSTDNTVRFSAKATANYAKDKQLWNLSIARGTMKLI